MSRNRNKAGFHFENKRQGTDVLLFSARERQKDGIEIPRVEDPEDKKAAVLWHSFY